MQSRHQYQSVLSLTALTGAEAKTEVKLSKTEVGSRSLDGTNGARTPRARGCMPKAKQKRECEGSEGLTVPKPRESAVVQNSEEREDPAQGVGHEREFVRSGASHS